MSESKPHELVSLDFHLEHSPVAVVTWDSSGRYIAWSRSAERIFGYTAREVVQDQVLADFHHVFGEDRPTLMEWLERLRRGEISRFSLEHRNLRKDGAVIWCQWHNMAVVGPGARMFLSYAIDITDRVLAEQQIRHEREVLERHLNNSPMAIVEWGPDLRLLRWTAGAQRILGWTADEMIGRRFDTLEPPLICPEDKTRVMEHVADLLTGRPTRASITARNRRKDGAVRWMNWHSSSVFDQKGKLVSLLSQGIDVTEQVLAKQLISDARERAEQASKAKDHFIAILSHELRTPLAPVRALLSVLREDPRLPQDVRDDLVTIARSCEAESRLIDDLLDVTSLTHGQVHVELRPCDAHAVLSQTAAAFAVAAQQKPITLTVRLEASGHTVLADAHRLRQVFGNLLSNAIKFTPAGGAVTVLTDNPAGDCLRIRVTDTGVGIDPQHLPKLFEPFERGEPQHRHQFAGLGLGLAIARSLLKLMNGTISADSPGAGQGATFTVILPATSAPVPGDPPRPTQDTSRPARPATILLVEDHRATAEILSKLLRRDGHEVHVAASVSAALELAGGLRFGVIVCDLGLPDGTGHDLLRQLRAANQTAPAIALSGYGMPADIAASQAAGFAQHLTKPVDFSTLRRAIASVAPT